MKAAKSRAQVFFPPNNNAQSTELPSLHGRQRKERFPRTSEIAISSFMAAKEEQGKQGVVLYHAAWCR